MKKCLIVSTVSRQFTLFERGNIEVLKKLGYEIHCVANYEDATEQLKGLGIIEHHIDIQRSPFSFKNIKAYKQLKNIINSDDFELMHCHSPMGGVLSRIAARKKRKSGKIKVFYTAHGFHFFKGAPKINWILYYPVEKWLSKYTDCLITINQEDYNVAKNKFKSKNVKLVNGIGVDKEKFDFEISSEEKHELRKSLGVKDNDFLIIYVAELSKRKNQVMLLEAIKELKKQGVNNIKVLLPGKDSLNGEYQEYVKRNKLEDEIKFLGFRNDVPKLMKISDLCISTSKQEGLPVNIMEAMMCKLPIIATDCRGNRDLIQDGVNGYIVNINDVKELTNKITLLKTTPIKPQNNVDEYSKEVIKIKMDKIYTDILNKKTKVLHILTTSNYSGAENVACTIIGNLNTEYNIVYCSPEGPIVEILKEKNIKHLPIKDMSLKELKRVINEFNPDIIHAHDYTASVKCSLIKKDKYLIEHLHNNSPWIGKVCMKSFAFLYAGLKANKILTVSESIKNEYIFSSAIKKKIECIYNPVSRKMILNQVSTQDYNKKYDICCVARLTEAKNPYKFLKIVGEIKKQMPDIKVVWIGDGDIKLQVENKINQLDLNKTVNLLGYQKNPYKFLAQSKIFLLTSDWEGYGLAAFEALTLGIPCVVSNVGGLPKIVDENCGKLCNTDRDYIETIINLLNNKDLLNSYSTNAIAKSKKLDNITAYINKIRKIYED